MMMFVIKGRHFINFFILLVGLALLTYLHFRLVHLTDAGPEWTALLLYDVTLLHQAKLFLCLFFFVVLLGLIKAYVPLSANHQLQFILSVLRDVARLLLGAVLLCACALDVMCRCLLLLQCPACVLGRWAATSSNRHNNISDDHHSDASPVLQFEPTNRVNSPDRTF